MNIVVFGLSVSSAWGNGHATLLRGLFRALHAEGHEIHFFEKDVPYYAAHRDAPYLPYAHIHLYSDWDANLPVAKQATECADVAIVTSYCPDGAAACDLVLESKPGLRSIFYDMDTPVTLSRLATGEAVPYLPARGLSGFDLVLSYTGGTALTQLKKRLQAGKVATLYGWVDPETHSRVSSQPEFTADLSYLGTYASDRQHLLQELLIQPAIRFPDRKFLIGGAMYPSPGNWPPNVKHYNHVAPPQHSAFYSSSLLTLSITRATMASMGFCPSGRLFEAAACGTAVLSDWWNGLDAFFEPNEEILIATSTDEAGRALNLSPAALANIGRRAKERVLACHTAAIRAKKLLDLIGSPADELPLDLESGPLNPPVRDTEVKLLSAVSKQA